MDKIWGLTAEPRAFLTDARKESTGLLFQIPMNSSHIDIFASVVVVAAGQVRIPVLYHHTQPRRRKAGNVTPDHIAQKELLEDIGT